MEKWEYEILVNPATIQVGNREEIKTILNAMGEAGWELIQAVPQTVPGDFGVDYSTAFLFKKPKAINI